MRQVHVESIDNPVNKFSFLNASTGYVAFRDFIGFTTDSGRTFIQRPITYGNVAYGNYSVNLLFGFTIAGVKALASNTIIVYGDYGFVPSILFSNDGGLNYSLVFHSRYDPMTLPGSVNDISFPAPGGNIGYAVDRDRIMKTVSSGVTWSVSATFPEYYFDQIITTDANNVYAISYSLHKIIRTVNGGSSWSLLNLPALPTGVLNDLFFLNNNIGWVKMDLDNSITHLYKTTNGGTTWSLQNNPEVPLNAGRLQFVNESTGYGFTGEGFDLAKTIDGGINWERIPKDNNYSYLLYGYEDLQILSSQLWAGGGHGFISLNTNLSGPTIPKAYFSFDTTGVAATGNVSLTNLSSGNNYQYAWYANNQFVSNSFNTNYHHINGSITDSIKLVVTKGSYKDSITRYIHFVTIPDPPMTTISSFSPDTGYVDAVVTINGANFAGISNVYFGNVPAASFTIVNSSQIRAVVGNGATGSIKVSSQYNTAIKPGFTFITRFQVNSFSPHSGIAGTVVTINGNGFSSLPAQNIVYFGTQRAEVVSASLNQLQVIVPPNAGTNYITVHLNGKTSTTTQMFSLTFPGDCNLYSHSFFAQKDFPTSFMPIELRSCDFDQDGYIDLINASEHFPTLTILRNRSNLNQPTLDSVLELSFEGIYGVRYHLHDLDGDGKTDLLVEKDSLFFLKNTSTPGSISFAPRISLVHGGGHLVDLDKDGLLDLVSLGVNFISILKNTSANGTISFNPSPIKILSPWVNWNVTYFEVADFDNDGKTDLMINGRYGNDRVFIIFRNTSFNDSIQFSDGQHFPITRDDGRWFAFLTTTDLDSDNKIDVMALSLDDDEIDSVYMVKNISTPGNLNFVSAHVAPVDFIPEGPGDMKTGDLNGDGKPEIIFGIWQWDRGIVILQNNSNANGINFGPPVEFSFEIDPLVKTLAVADFNNDGKPDIAASHSYQSVTWADNPVISIYQSNLCGPAFFEYCPGENLSITSNINGSTYQWQILNGTNFVNLTNGPNYNSVTSPSLNILSTPSAFYGNRYRCLVNGTDYSYEFQIRCVNEWNGLASQFWNNPQNWSCGLVPDANTDVVINYSGTVIINANATCHSLSGSGGVNIVVNNGVTFTITH